MFMLKIECGLSKDNIMNCHYTVFGSSDVNCAFSTVIKIYVYEFKNNNHPNRLKHADVI